MKKLTDIFQMIAAVTCMTAYNLLRLGGLNLMPLRLAVADEGTETFEKEVLGGLKSMRTKQDELVQNYDNLHKDTKKAFEELTVVKNKLNDFGEFETKLKKVELQMRREVRMANGNPLQRIAHNEELRLRMNAAVRLAAGGDESIRKAGHTLAERVGKALQTGTTPGSTMMNNDLYQEMYDILATYGIWNTFAVRRLGTSTTKFPVKTARAVAKFVRKLSNRKLAEDSTIAGTSVDCDVSLAGVLLSVERELLEDAEFDVTSYVLEDFGEAMALLMDHVCLTADGTDDENDDSYEGIFNTGTAATAAAGNTTVETLDFEDFVRCLTTVAPVVLQRQARWWIHPTSIARAMAVKDLNGRPIFLTATEAPTYGGIGSMLGYAVTPAFAAPSANTAGSKVAAFGDPNGHVFGLRQDFAFESSDDFQFDSVSRTFRGTARFGSITRRANAFAILTTAAS